MKALLTVLAFVAVVVSPAVAQDQEPPSAAEIEAAAEQYAEDQVRKRMISERAFRAAQRKRWQQMATQGRKVAGSIVQRADGVERFIQAVAIQDPTLLELEREVEGGLRTATTEAQEYARVERIVTDLPGALTSALTDFASGGLLGVLTGKIPPGGTVALPAPEPTPAGPGPMTAADVAAIVENATAAAGGEGFFDSPVVQGPGLTLLAILAGWLGLKGVGKMRATGAATRQTQMLALLQSVMGQQPQADLKPPAQRGQPPSTPWAQPPSQGERDIAKEIQSTSRIRALNVPPNGDAAGASGEHTTR